MASSWMGSWRRLWNVLVPTMSGLFIGGFALDLSERRSGVVVAVVAALAVVQAGALTRRLVEPVSAMAVVTVASFVVQVLAPELVIAVPMLFALGTLAIERSPVVSMPGLAAAIGVTAVSFSTMPAEDPLFGMAFCVAVWSWGLAIRMSRIAAKGEASRLVAEERAHLEREIHDILAHGLSVMIVQAAAADDVFDAQPDEARRALRAIERQGRDSLGEIRQLLGAGPGGHRADRDGPDAEASRSPLPGLADLAALAERLSEAGAELVIGHDGDPIRLPAGVELSAYRIVQEAATNSLRHGRATRIEVTLRHRVDGLAVEVVDNGVAGRMQGLSLPGAVAGRGLIGMRERAALHGGSLATGPVPTGGYAVRAWLPAEAAGTETEAKAEAPTATRAEAGV